MNIGAAIRVLRTRRELKQWELADLLGVSSSYMSLVERNKRDPSVGFVRNVAEKLDTPLPLLFLLAEEKAEAGDDKTRYLLIEHLLGMV